MERIKPRDRVEKSGITAEECANFIFERWGTSPYADRINAILALLSNRKIRLEKVGHDCQTHKALFYINGCCLDLEEMEEILIVQPVKKETNEQINYTIDSDYDPNYQGA